MEYLRIKYRDKEYLLEDLLKESTDLLRILELPKEFQVSDYITEWGLINDKGYAIAGEKYCDLFSVLASARFALYNAHLKIHKNELNWESGYFSQFWLRGQYLKNSIIWYNSCEDYILQIIWFAFDFFSDLTNYKKEMQSCRYIKIIETFENHNQFQNTQSILQKIKNYHDNKHVSYIRELANLIKHKQNIRIKDLDMYRLIQVKSGEFSSKYIEKECVDIDEAISSLTNVHKEIVELGEYLFSFIELPKMFVYNNRAEIMMDKKKEKREYKKLIINENYYT